MPLLGPLSSSGAWTFEITRGFPLQLCLPRPVVLRAAFRWQWGELSPGHPGAATAVLWCCCCFCAAVLVVFAHPKGYVSFAVFLVESDCHQHEWEFPSPFVSLCFPESHLNHWSLLHTISHRLCKDIFVYLSFLKPVPIFFKMYRISVFFHNP